MRLKQCEARASNSEPPCKNLAKTHIRNVRYKITYWVCIDCFNFFIKDYILREGVSDAGYPLDKAFLHRYINPYLIE